MRLTLAEGRFYENLFEKMMIDFEDGIPNTTDRKKYVNGVIDGIVKKHAERSKRIRDIIVPILESPATIADLWFLTIRPTEDLPLHKFFEMTELIMKKRLWNSYKLVFEQKGETEDELGKGKHFHAKVRVSSPSKGIKYHIQEIHKTFKKEGFEDFISINNICLKKITDEIGSNRTDNYMNVYEFGKCNIDKELCWKQDSLWRHNNNLKDYYECDDDFKKSKPNPTTIIDLLCQTSTRTK